MFWDKKSVFVFDGLENSKNEMMSVLAILLFFAHYLTFQPFGSWIQQRKYQVEMNKLSFAKTETLSDVFCKVICNSAFEPTERKSFFPKTFPLAVGSLSDTAAYQVHLISS